MQGSSNYGLLFVCCSEIKIIARILPTISDKIYCLEVISNQMSYPFLQNPVCSVEYTM